MTAHSSGDFLHVGKAEGKESCQETCGICGRLFTRDTPDDIPICEPCWRRAHDPDDTIRPSRHWHLFAHHVHPEWHGHCKRGHTCSRLHWHLPFRHRHTEDGR